MDCGHCDFCCDKPKFGGSNQKRQKCRWRQCLQFAMVGDAEESGGWDELTQGPHCLGMVGRPRGWGGPDGFCIFRRMDGMVGSANE